MAAGPSPDTAVAATPRQRVGSESASGLRYLLDDALASPETPKGRRAIRVSWRHRQSRTSRPSDALLVHTTNGEISPWIFRALRRSRPPARRENRPPTTIGRATTSARHSKSDCAIRRVRLVGESSAAIGGVVGAEFPWIGWKQNIVQIYFPATGDHDGNSQ